MNLLEQLQAENAALKASLQQKDEKIVSLEKLNSWYIDQLKSRQKEKFGASSENMMKTNFLFLIFLMKQKPYENKLLLNQQKKVLFPHIREKSQNAMHLLHIYQ